MKALDRKLLRDLWRSRGQGLTIALVVACGVASYVALASTWDSLERAQTTYYERYRFADVFAHLKRAPEPLARRIEAIPGVALVMTRVTESVLIPLEDRVEPAVGHIISLPEHGEEPALDAVYLRKGRMPEPGRDDEVLVSEAFALAHHFEPGDSLVVVLNGVERRAHIVGLALSPEFVFSVSGGELLADDAGFAVLWMDRRVVASAYRIDGAFNDCLLRLQPGAPVRPVLDALDALLEPYGGVGALPRERQPSHAVLKSEFDQLARMTTFVPGVFLTVAVFLLNVVLTRLVQLQRGQIAALKALGYGHLAIGAHYAKLVASIGLVGALAGVGLGAWLGGAMTELYARYYHFPIFAYRLGASTVVLALVASVLAALAGAALAVMRVVRLPPAEAMRPETPAVYRRSLLERVGLGVLLGTSSRMVLRELTRNPMRTFVSILGIALAVAITVMARFGYDAVDLFMDLQFEGAQREDLAVTLRTPAPLSAQETLRSMPGVLAVEPLRAVPVRLRAGHRFRDTVLYGHPKGAQLRRLLEWPLREVQPDGRGLVLTTKLAEILGVEPGGELEVTPLEGPRVTRRIVVAGVVNELFGLQAHLELEALHRFLGEEISASMFLLQVDSAALPDVHRRLREMPAVAGVMARATLIDRFHKQTGETMGTTTLILTLFAATIAIGIVYNNARIALSLRSRDLASMRVLGFTRREISAVLLGELGAYVLFAIPPGLLLGRSLSQALANSEPEVLRFPAATSLGSYAFAASVTFLAALVSALLVRRRLDHLDLVAVLKTRE